MFYAPPSKAIIFKRVLEVANNIGDRRFCATFDNVENVLVAENLDWPGLTEKQDTQSRKMKKKIRRGAAIGPKKGYESFK